MLKPHTPLHGRPNYWGYLLQKLAETMLTFGIITAGIIAANVFVFYLVPASPARHLIMYRVFIPVYTVLGLFILGSLIAEAVAAYYHSRHGMAATPTLPGAGAVRALIARGDYHQLRAFITRHYFVDFFDVTDYLFLQHAYRTGKSATTWLEYHAKHIALASNHKHTLKIATLLADYLSADEIDRLRDLHRQALVGPTAPERTTHD